MADGARPDVVLSLSLLERYLDLGALPPSLRVVTVSGSPEEEAARAMAEARAIVTVRIPPGTLAGAHRLEFIQVPAAGLDGIPFDDLPDGVTVARTGHHGRSIAEYALMAMILMGRRLLATDHALRGGVWNVPYASNDPGAFIPRTLEGQTVLTIGLGEIGREIAALASAFDMRVLAIRRSPAAGAGIPGVDTVASTPALHQMLEEADHVVVAVPLTDETAGMIGPKELRRMKPTATLVNVARGPVVDPVSLYRALEDGAIAGAAIDVWYHYPADATPVRPADPPFEGLDNVLMTPHLSGVTENTFKARARDVAGNLRRFFSGEPPRNVVWPPS